MSLNVTSSSPIREQLRALCLDIHVLIQQCGNGEQANAATQVAAIKVVVDAIKTQIDAATNASITTL